MRCIYLASTDIDSTIQSFRLRHDPLGSLIQPHVTVVFPFESGVSDDELIAHILDAVAGITAITCSLGEVVSTTDGYIYFRIEKGAGAIREIHDRLYSGPMQQFLRNDIEYAPHITVGRVEPAEVESICSSARDLVIEPGLTLSQLFLERVGEQGDSSDILKHALLSGAEKRIAGR